LLIQQEKDRWVDQIFSYSCTSDGQDLHALEVPVPRAVTGPSFKPASPRRRRNPNSRPSDS